MNFTTIIILAIVGIIILGSIIVKIRSIINFFAGLFHIGNHIKDVSKAHVDSKKTDFADDGRKLDMGGISEEYFFDLCESCGVWYDLKIEDVQLQKQISKEVCEVYSRGEQNSSMFYNAVTSVFKQYNKPITAKLYDLLVEAHLENMRDDA